jgi:hypothetical protein
MTSTIEAKKLSDAPEYQAARSKLTDLKQTEATLKSAIRETEDALRRDVDRVLPDERKNIRLRDQREELVATQRAIAEQEQAVANARAVASRTICESEKPQHDQAQRQMAISLIAANKAALAAANIREQLDRDDVAGSSLHVALFPELGMASFDPCSRLSYLVRDCLAHALLERSEVPADWLRRWGI